MSGDKTRSEKLDRLLAALSRAPDAEQAPVMLRHFRILGRLGAGGMGEVLKAEDTRLGRIVAIKRLDVSNRGHEAVRQRLLREARIASGLVHPCIVTIFAIDEIDGEDFIVMEHVEGEPLDRAIEKGRLPLERVLEIAADVAAALGTAHAAGVVHRDIKPSNVILGRDGRAKVLDFGIARPPVADTGLTEPGTILGTIPYMAPEQLSGEQVDGRADLYSLGCLIYEAATGRRAFHGPDVAALIRQVSTVDPPPPSTLVPSLPAAFDAFVSRAMAKQADRRFPDAAALVAAMREAVAGVARVAPEAQPREPDSILVGRDAELSLLGGLVSRAQAGGAGGLVLLSGHAGIGKSALTDEVLRRARGGALLAGRGRCLEQAAGGEAYQPILDALEELLEGEHRDLVREALRAVAPTWSLWLHIAVESGERAAMERAALGVTKERLVRELIDALAALAARVPVLLVLEDVHWAEPSTVDTLRHLAYRLERHRALVIATLRAEEIEAADHPLRATLADWRSKKSVREVQLGELGPDDVVAWLDARFRPNDFAASLAPGIHARTEGHALFVSNMIDLLVAKGLVVRADGGWRASAVDTSTLGVPHNLRAMLRVKLDGLAADDRRALEAAAVQGVECTSIIVADALEADPIEVDDRLAAMARSSHLLRADGEQELPDGSLATCWRFAHVLYRDTILEDLVAARRVQLSRRIGEALLRRHGDQAGRIAAVLGPHFEAGRDFDRAAEQLARAGENAMARCAPVEADTHVVRALACATRLPAERRSARIVPLLRQRAVILTSMGHFDEAQAELDRALTLARAAGDALLEGQVHVAKADVLLAWHRLADAAPHLDAALAIAAAEHSEPLREEALAMRALERLIVGELDACGEALEGLGDPGPLALHLRGLLHYFRSEYGAAEARFVLAAETNERSLADGLLLMESRMFAALARANDGRLGEALRGLEATLALAERSDLRSMVARLENSIGWVHRELGQIERALEHDLRAVAAGRESEESEAEANGLVNLSEDRLVRGEIPAAGEPFARVSELADVDAWLRWRYLLRLDAARARERLARGELGEAREAVASLRARAERQRAGKYLALSFDLEARIAVAGGDVAGARRAIDEARAVLAGTPSPLVAWRLESLAARLGDRGARDRARVVIERIAAGLVPGQREAFLSSADVRVALEA